MIQPGDLLICSASVTDGYGASSLASTSVTVNNTAPVIASVTITPANPYNDDSLTAPKALVMRTVSPWSLASIG